MNWYKKSEHLYRPEAKADQMLPHGATDVRINEEGRSARGKCPCPECGTISKFTACSDVGGLWIWCEKCGLIDW
jgi:predicted RNA-binding Zn-ribbon protein involved in translation (DUF1610 family)